MSDRLALNPVEQRVLGALLEKQRTVPDTYPLSLNALRMACNQSTSRDPVVNYDDTTLIDTLNGLRDRELIRFVKRTGVRVVKYHQRLTEHLDLDEEQAALVTLLLLRGPQTPGELLPRLERIHPFVDRDGVEDALREFAALDPPLVRELERQPGHRDQRWMHLLGADEPAAEAAPAPVDREAVLAQGAGARDRLVATEYDRLAEAYADALGDELAGKPFDRWLLDRAAEAAAEGQGLDVGCGPGQIAGYLAGRGVAMTGLDLSPAMVEWARAGHPEVEFRQGSFVVPPMPRGGDPRDPGWHLITAWYAVVHLAGSEIAPTVAALTRVLRRGGTLALATHVGHEVLHPGSVVGVPTALDFVLHDEATLIGACEAAGLVDLEWYVRGPLADEAMTPRMYLIGRKPV